MTGSDDSMQTCRASPESLGSYHCCNHSHATRSLPAERRHTLSVVRVSPHSALSDSGRLNSACGGFATTLCISITLVVWILCTWLRCAVWIRITACAASVNGMHPSRLMLCSNVMHETTSIYSTERRRSRNVQSIQWTEYINA